MAFSYENSLTKHVSLRKKLILGKSVDGKSASLYCSTTEPSLFVV